MHPFEVCPIPTESSSTPTNSGEVRSVDILMLNHAYNEGKLTFTEWLTLTRQWALRLIEKYEGKEK